MPDLAAKVAEDLKTAFAGESQANRKYLAYAEQADADGFPNVAKLFRAAAEAETIHAHGHLRAMGGVKSTQENLRDAVGGETYEYTEMYPPMLENAKRESHKGARMFGLAMKAEEVHAGLYKKALAAVQAGKDIEEEAYLCPVCGYVELGKAPERCPICGAPQARFKKIG